MSALRIDSGAAPRRRRRLGPVPWFVLEELILLAGGDSAVETNVRALAANLSLNKDTVARALGRLRDEGLVVSEPQPNPGGCFGAARYQPGPVAGLQRLDDEGTSTRSPHPQTPASVPQQATSIQLSLIDGPPGRRPAPQVGEPDNPMERRRTCTRGAGPSRARPAGRAGRCPDTIAAMLSIAKLRAGQEDYHRAALAAGMEELLRRNPRSPGPLGRPGRRAPRPDRRRRHGRGLRGDPRRP